MFNQISKRFIAFVSRSAGIIDSGKHLVMGSNEIIDPSNIFVMGSSEIIDPALCETVGSSRIIDLSLGSMRRISDHNVCTYIETCDVFSPV